jgi:hypothetical protein
MMTINKIISQSEQLTIMVPCKVSVILWQAQANCAAGFGGAVVGVAAERKIANRWLVVVQK